MSGRFGSLLTAMITPLKGNGDVDNEGAAKLAKQLVEDGNDGLVICGTTGEAPTLSTEEKLTLWSAVKEAVGKDIPMIAGTGSYCTKSTIELSNKAADAGADGLLLVAPYYNKPSAAGLREHFKTIHSETDLPIMLYNIPGRSSVEIPTDVLVELSALERVVAVKQSLPIDPVSRLCSRLSATPGVIDTYSGDDSQTLPQLAIGGLGVVSVAGHIVGSEIKDMLTKFFAGKVKEAAAIHQRLFPLFEVLFVTSNPVPVKHALELMGRPAGPVRQPLWPGSKEDLKKVENVMRDLGLL